MESPELTKVEGEGLSITSAEDWLTRPNGMPSGNLNKQSKAHASERLFLKQA